MANPELPVEAGGQIRPPRGSIEIVANISAVLGGLLALSVALLATASVLMRWLFSAPIDGDFEFVKMATAVAVFAYLPYTQTRRGNIMVDTFTSWMSPRARDLIDALWDLVYAAFMGFVAVSLVIGASEAMRSGETTMQRQILVWPSIAVAAGLCALLTITTLFTAGRLLRKRADRRPS